MKLTVYTTYIWHRTCSLRAPWSIANHITIAHKACRSWWWEAFILNTAADCCTCIHQFCFFVLFVSIFILFFVFREEMRWHIIGYRGARIKPKPALNDAHNKTMLYIVIGLQTGAACATCAIAVADRRSLSTTKYCLMYIIKERLRPNRLTIADNCELGECSMLACFRLSFFCWLAGCETSWWAQSLACHTATNSTSLFCRQKKKLGLRSLHYDKHSWVCHHCNGLPKVMVIDHM